MEHCTKWKNGQLEDKNITHPTTWLFPFWDPKEYPKKRTLLRQKYLHSFFCWSSEKIPCASGGFSRGVNIELHGVVESTKPIKMNSLSQYQIINKSIPEHERKWRRAAECVEVTDPINLETLESRNKIHLDLEGPRQNNL